MVGARLARHRLSVGNGRKNTSYQHERGKVVIAVAFEAGKPARRYGFISIPDGPLMGVHGRWRFRDLKLWLRGFVAPCGSASEKALYDKDRPSRVQNPCISVHDLVGTEGYAD